MDLSENEQNHSSSMAHSQKAELYKWYNIGYDETTTKIYFLLFKPSRKGIYHFNFYGVGVHFQRLIVYLKYLYYCIFNIIR